MLKKVDGRWALVSKKTLRPLAYYKGEGKPSDEWVAKQERRIQFFKHGGMGEETIQEASYPGNIGMMEVFKFFQIADEKQKKKFNDLVKNKKEKEAWNFMQQVTGVKLHPVKTVKESFSKERPPSMHFVAWDYNKLKSKGYTEDDVIHHYNKHYSMKLKRGDIQKHIDKTNREIEARDVAQLQSFKKREKVKEEVKPDILPKSGAGAWGTDTLVKSYTKDTPGQSFKDFKKKLNK